MRLDVWIEQTAWFLWGIAIGFLTGYKIMLWWGLLIQIAIYSLTTTYRLIKNLEEFQKEQSR